MRILLPYLIFCFLTQALFAQKNNEKHFRFIDSCLTKLKNAKHDSDRITLLNSIGSKYDYLNDISKTIYYAQKAAFIANKSGLKKSMPITYTLIGSTYFQHGNLDSALYYFSESEKICLKLDDKKNLGAAYNNMGVVYKNKSYYKKSIHYYIKSLRLCKQINDTIGEISSYNNIGNVYLNMENYDKALEYYTTGLKLAKKNNYRNTIANAYRAIGIIYSAKSDFKKALEYLLLTVKLKTTINNSLAHTYNMLGHTYYKLKNNKKALNNCLKGLAIYQKNQNLSGLSYSLYYIALVYSDEGRYNSQKKYDLKRVNLEDCYLLKKDFDQELNEKNVIESKTFSMLDKIERAFVLFNQSLLLSKKIDDKALQKGIYFDLSDLCKKIHKYDLAYSFLSSHVQLRDSIYNTELHQQISQLSAEYETELKEKKIELLTKDIKAKEIQNLLEQKNKHLTFISIGIISVLVVLMIIGLFIYYKRQQQRTIEKLEKQKLISELNALKNQVSPHTMFNNLNSIYFEIDSDASSAKEMLLKVSDLLRYQLYEGNKDFIEIEKEIEFLKKYIAIQQLRKSERCEITFNVDESVKEMMIAHLLLLPFIENAFKYVSNDKEANNFIHISLTRTKKGLVFLGENTTYDIPTVNSKHSGGMGLANIKNRLALLYLNKYELSILNENRVFKVKLIIYD